MHIQDRHDFSDFFAHLTKKCFQRDLIPARSATNFKNNNFKARNYAWIRLNCCVTQVALKLNIGN